MKATFYAVSLVALAIASPAAAQSVAALVGDNTIAIVDASTRKVTKTFKVSGVEGALVGIDVRPADGMLYGLATNGTVVTIDTKDGKATMKSKLDTMLAPGTMGTMDFNPVADRLRIIGADGTNLRANVDDGKVTTDGKLKFADSDMHKGEMPKIVAAAYTNSMKGAKETTLYDIDATIGGLIKQAPPNDGVLNAVGKLGIANATSYAFDIAAKADGQNEGWLMVGDMLHSVDLMTGKTMAAGKVEGLTGPVRKITVMPAM